jgi:ligand-binding sensor domain-containing protein/anti-sigma regulatory factor (Ser/Thr protein kinase)
MRFRLPIAALLLALSGALYGVDPSRTLTQYVHRIWQTQQGLPESSIYSLLQTHDGYLWLGTQTGLVRFDGVRFTTLENIYPNAPANVWIRSAVEDSQGALWIGTNESGLFRLAGGAVTHFSQTEGLPSNTVQCLTLFKDDVWACTPSGLVRVSNGKITVYRVADGLSGNDVRAAVIGVDGNLWIGADNARLSVWNGAGFDRHPLTSVPADAGVRALVASGSDKAGQGVLWIGTTAGLIQLKNGVEHLFTVKHGLADDWILGLSTSRDGSLWIGTRNGFSRWREGEIVSFKSKDGLSQSTVFSIYEDREGSLWVGTKLGLNQFSDGRAVPFTVNEGLPTNETGPVLQDRRGDMWIGTLGAGLSRFDGHRFTSVTVSNGLASDFINALAQGPNGGATNYDVLWVGTDRGLNRLRGGRVDQTFTTAQGLPANNVRDVLIDDAGVVWVATQAGPAALRNGKFDRPPGIATQVPVVALGQDAAHRIYFATANGVQVYEDGKTRELTQNNAPLRSVDAFYRDPEGVLWIGMLSGGLRMLENGKISTFLMRDGLFDTEIYGIVGDQQDRLWMACSKGIFWVRRSDLRRFAAGQLAKITSNPYSPTDAQRVIESKSGVQPSASLSSDGRLWFSTIRGLLVLDSRHLQRNTPPPPIVVEDIVVNGERLEPGEIGALAPGRKNIEFRYTGLSFLAPGRITFRYMLEGYDKDWVNAGTRREAYYTNLPPGTLRFRVNGCNNDGMCNEAGSGVRFKLASHYYQRPWFWPVCVLALGMAIWLAYQLRIRRLREHFSLILTERNRIARELHDTLIQGLSGITMEMQALAARMRAPEERSTLDDIIQDAGTCLRETRRSVAGLRSGQSNSGLASALEQAARQLTEAKPIRLKLKLGKNGKGLPADVEYNLVRIAQEAVTNSVKHSGARTVEVALDYSQRAVHLSVKDDGSGFASEVNGHGRSGHYGLIGMKERASHIGAELELASAPGRGTVVSVTLPSGQNGNHE